MSLRGRKDVEDGEKCTEMSFMVCTYQQTFLGMWSVWGRRGIHTRFSSENHRERDRSEDSGAGGRMNGWRGLGTVNLGQNRDKLWALVHKAVNLKIPQTAGIS